MSKAIVPVDLGFFVVKDVGLYANCLLSSLSRRKLKEAESTWLLCLTIYPHNDSGKTLRRVYVTKIRNKSTFKSERGQIANVDASAGGERIFVLFGRQI
jgi:hypothetical protein